jgi:methionyl-tRNA formyltransferase
MDTGPVLARAPVSISPLDTTGSMTDKLARIGANLLLDVMPRWLKGQIASQAQDESLATLTRKFEKEDGEIDWSLSAKELSLRVRAFTPWPGTYTRWQGKQQVKITRAVPLPAATGVKPGQVTSLEGGRLGIGTGDGVLGVLQLQLEGKREMTAHDFLNGQRDFLGAVLPS